MYLSKVYFFKILKVYPANTQLLSFPSLLLASRGGDVPTNKTLQDFSSFSTLVSGCSLRCVQPALSPSPSQPALSPPPHLRHLGLSHALLPPPRLHNILFCFQRSSYAVIFHSVQPCQPSMAGAYNMIKFCVVSLPLALFTPSQSLSTLDVSTEKHLHLK